MPEPASNIMEDSVNVKSLFMMFTFFILRMIKLLFFHTSRPVHFQAGIRKACCHLPVENLPEHVHIYGAYILKSQIS